ncbi:MAG TPA: HAMP domain-containing sensor histidine kinase, partial [Terracidiphilus sp.]|nr:HAMP domain-containing sensor histidine kinase [Terracidiphilus sp.]
LLTQSTLKFHRQTGMPRVSMLSEILEGVAAMFRGRLNAAEMTLDVRVTDEIAIACMPSEMQQIFANLLANSIEATPPGGRLIVRLRPSVDWRDHSRRGMRVTFADTGVGMDRETRRRIFEPFFTTKIETGTGLGMWVVAQLVERHGGDIRLWSTPRYGASGTAISVFLPTEFAAPEGVEAGVEAGVGAGVEVGAGVVTAVDERQPV